MYSVAQTLQTSQTAMVIKTPKSKAHSILANPFDLFADSSFDCKTALTRKGFIVSDTLTLKV